MGQFANLVIGPLGRFGFPLSYTNSIGRVECAARAGDAVLSAPTGSGKTLAALCPLLVLCAAELDRRGESTTEAVATSSELSPTDAMAALAPALTADGSGLSATAIPPRGPPLGLILAPRDELAEQIGQLAYSLVGGYARASREWRPGASDSLFKFSGPKGCRIVVLRERATDVTGSIERAQRDCDVLIASPAALEALSPSDLSSLLESCRVAAVDEADITMEEPISGRCLEALPTGCNRLLVGATIGEGLIRSAVGKGWLRSPLTLADGSGNADEWVDDGGAVSSSPSSIPSSVVHRACLGADDASQLVLLSRLMRGDLRAWEQLQQKDGKMPRPRCVVFTSDESAARDVASALRGSLWGDHAVSVLLPTEGAKPAADHRQVPSRCGIG